MSVNSNESPFTRPQPESHKCEAVLTIPHAAGLHARPAAVLARTAQRYDSEIRLRRGARTVDGKSILGILTLCASQGSEVIVTAEGCDAHEAARAIKRLFGRALCEDTFAPGMGLGVCQTLASPSPPAS